MAITNICLFSLSFLFKLFCRTVPLWVCKNPSSSLSDDSDHDAAAGGCRQSPLPQLPPPPNSCSSQLPYDSCSSQLPNKRCSSQLPNSSCSSQLPNKRCSSQLPNNSCSSQLPNNSCSPQLWPLPSSCPLPQQQSQTRFSNGCPLTQQRSQSSCSSRQPLSSDRCYPSQLSFCDLRVSGSSLDELPPIRRKDH